MSDSFPSFEEIQSTAGFHLEQADRQLSARYPWWSSKAPNAEQRRWMRRAARKVRKAQRILNDAPTTPPRLPDAPDHLR